MDEHSKEELRVYALLQELPKAKYHEDELRKIFGFSGPLNKTKLYKYIHLEKQNLHSRIFTVLKGELVTGNDVIGRSPVLRGKYKITTIIDGVPFVYVERVNHGKKDRISERE